MSDQSAWPDQPEQAAAWRERPWIVLHTTFDVEAWIDQQNRALQAALGPSVMERGPAGAGICFRLREGGEIFLHTNPDGDVLLDVTEEASWVTPVLTAATGEAAPNGTLWLLPGSLMTQLLLGLGSLIEATRLVRQHLYTRSKWR